MTARGSKVWGWEPVRWDPGDGSRGARSQAGGKGKAKTKKKCGKKVYFEKRKICDMRRRCVVWCACGEKGRAALAGFCVARMELWEMVAEPK